MKKVLAPCAVCLGQKNHSVLYEVTDQEEDVTETSRLLRCNGCDTVSMSKQVFYGGQPEAMKYYPSPVTRKKPDWLWELSFGFRGEKDDDKLADLLKEVYEAIDGGQHRLAAMGIRALLEQVMIVKVGDLESFDMKLDAFEQKGFISLIQRKAMRATLDIGDAAMHRAYKPAREDLKSALDIVEGVFAAVFVQQSDAEKIAGRVPPRKPAPR